MNNLTGNAAGIAKVEPVWRVGGRAALNQLVSHELAMPVSAMTVVVCAAILANQVLAWKLDQATLPALPEIPPPAASAALLPLRVSSDGFVPRDASASLATAVPAVSSAPAKSALPVELIGTFVAGHGPKAASRSLAIVQLTAGSREVEILRLGEKWQGIELLEVERSRIWVRNLSSGQKEYISNDQLIAQSIDLSPKVRLPAPRAAPPSPAAHAASGSEEIVLSRSQVNRAIDNNSQVIFSWVDVQPHAVAGQIEGFKLNNIKPRGKPFFNILGFKEGDIVKRVNGLKMDSVDKAVGLWAALHGKDEVSFTIERQGVQKELNLVFKP